LISELISLKGTEGMQAQKQRVRRRRRRKETKMQS